MGSAGYRFTAHDNGKDLGGDVAAAAGPLVALRDPEVELTTQAALVRSRPARLPAFAIAVSPQNEYIARLRLDSVCCAMSRKVSCAVM